MVLAAKSHVKLAAAQRYISAAGINGTGAHIAVPEFDFVSVGRVTPSEVDTLVGCRIRPGDDEGVRRRCAPAQRHSPGDDSRGQWQPASWLGSDSVGSSGAGPPTGTTRHFCPDAPMGPQVPGRGRSSSESERRSGEPQQQRSGGGPHDEKRRERCGFTFAVSLAEARLEGWLGARRIREGGSC